MTPPAARTRAAAAVAAAAAPLAVLALAASCGGPRRPPPPKPDRDPLVLLGDRGASPAPTLADLLATYPLESAPYRADLLATDAERSIWLIQTRRGVPAHFHRTHRERAWVLSGSGTFYVDSRSYPAVEGSAFRVEAGLVHRLAASEEGPVIVALAVFEPPMTSIDEDRVRVGE